MKILQSGSFINLENREKIEELIFTAKELAGATIAAEGFVDNPASNQRLALELWQGSEFVCRAHEEATIKNIFLSNFLQRLRELIKQQSAHVNPLPTTAVSENRDRDASRPVEGSASADEFLGLVESEVGDAAEESRARSYADECIPPGEVEVVAKAEKDFEEPLAAPTEDPVRVEATAHTQQPPIMESVSVEQIESVLQQPAEIRSSDNSIESIVLTEKEPYNFEACTITAVIQLLPVQGETRKCIISVRTHDFSPQITISELTADRFSDDLLNALQASYSQYRNDLPEKSADKLKKEKTTNKKRTAKPAESAKQNSAQSANKISESGTNSASTVTPVNTAVLATDQASLFPGS